MPPDRRKERANVSRASFFLPRSHPRPRRGSVPSPKFLLFSPTPMFSPRRHSCTADSYCGPTPEQCRCCPRCALGLALDHHSDWRPQAFFCRCPSFAAATPLHLTVPAIGSSSVTLCPSLDHLPSLLDRSSPLTSGEEEQLAEGCGAINTADLLQAVHVLAELEIKLLGLLVQSTLNGSTSYLADSSGRPYTTLFSGQSAAVPGFHPYGGLQGLHNIHGSFNLPNVPGSLTSREAAMGVVPSGGVQQPGGSIPSGRFSSNNLLIPHGSGVTNRGGINVVGNHAFSSSSINEVTGSITGISSSSASGNRSSVPGLGVSPVLGNVGPRLTSSVGNIVGSGNMGRSISSGGLSLPRGYSGYQDGIRGSTINSISLHQR
ncbi:hypothetical protein ZIOFF_018442 [Zingiber officinale]|uniref:Uncharacterized protein n=1 Tax=Zingiber officinale TaxID=94328 RepID=A0A8J5HQC4_ZINOF|nr:hypothetical protein ZIOFF_018442 [Zingiber officinale]